MQLDRFSIVGSDSDYQLITRLCLGRVDIDGQAQAEDGPEEGGEETTDEGP